MINVDGEALPRKIRLTTIVAKMPEKQEERAASSVDFDTQ